MSKHYVRETRAIGIPLAIIAAFVLAAFAFGGCFADGSNHCEDGKGDCSREDALDTRDADNTAPRVYLFNNHYPNIETKCDGFGHRIYVSTHDSATGDNVIVIADPSCDGYTSETATAATLQSNGGN